MSCLDPPVCISGVGSFPEWSRCSQNIFQFLRCRKITFNRDFLYLRCSCRAGIWRAGGPLASPCLSLCPSVCLCIHLCIHTSVGMSVNLSTCLSIHPYICMSVSLSTAPTSTPVLIPGFVGFFLNVLKNISLAAGHQYT